MKCLRAVARGKYRVDGTRKIRIRENLNMEGIQNQIKDI
jgi:hypothetical protein